MMELHVAANATNIKEAPAYGLEDIIMSATPSEGLFDFVDGAAVSEACVDAWESSQSSPFH